MKRPARLLSIPTWALRLGGRLLGKRAAADRLCGSLTVDGGRLRRLLDWSPPCAIDLGIGRTVEWYLGPGYGGHA